MGWYQRRVHGEHLSHTWGHHQHRPGRKMDLTKVPGCHVYRGTAPLAAGIAKIPKERNLLFNIDAETEDALKDVSSFKVPTYVPVLLSYKLRWTQQVETSRSF